MARTTKLLALTNIALLRETNYKGTKRSHYFTKRFATVKPEENEREIEEVCGVSKGHHHGHGMTNNNWVPHPRNGIYFPEGQEWVMNDVPDDAASLGLGHTNYWLRNIDGVEKHDPDLPSADHYFRNWHHDD